MEVVSIVANPPTTWEVTTLGTICKEGGGDIQTGPFGSQLHASDYAQVGIPSVMPVNIGDSRILTEGICRITDADAQRLSRYRLKVGDIVYSRRGDVERLALVREHEDGWLCGTGCLRVRFGKGKVNPLYASYYLGHPSVRQWVVQHAIGATMPNLNTGILSALPFLCPPLPVQQAIADILGSLDDKIELNRKMNETLEAMARALFKSWFVDFDPVVAKSEGRQPEGMDAETARLFPDSFEESEIGRVPKRWNVGTVGDLASLSRDSINPAQFADEVFGHFSLPAFDDGRLPKAELGNSIKSNKFVVPAGCVLLSKLNPRIPRVWMPDTGGHHRPLCSTEFLVSVPRQGVSREFLYLLFMSADFCDRFATYVTGTSGSHQRVKPESLLSIGVVVPTKGLFEAFSSVVRPLLTATDTNIRQSCELANARYALLPRLVSGVLAIR